MRRLIKLLVFGTLVVVVLIVGMAIALLPPAALKVPSQGLVLRAVTVVNPGLDRRLQQTLTVRGEHIESIVDAVPGEVAPEATARFAGAYVLPGLIDMHVHHPAAIAVGETQLFSLLYLEHGVTTVRDTGNFDGSILKTRRRIRDGAFPGPRIFACGPVLDGEPAFWPNSRIVKDASEARDAVAEVAAQGADCIKVYNSLSAEALAAVREAAAQRRLPVIGHVPLAIPFEDAHLDDVQHLTGGAGAAHAADWSGQLRETLQHWRHLDTARIDFIVRTSVQQSIVTPRRSWSSIASRAWRTTPGNWTIRAAGCSHAITARSSGIPKRKPPFRFSSICRPTPGRGSPR